MLAQNLYNDPNQSAFGRVSAASLYAVLVTAGLKTASGAAPGVIAMADVMLVKLILPVRAGAALLVSLEQGGAHEVERPCAVKWECSTISIKFATGVLACMLSAPINALRHSGFLTLPSGSSCKDDEESIAYMWDRTGWGTVFKHGNNFCCPKSQPMPYKNCHWVGSGDCAHNTCNENEVTLEVDSRGDSYSGCSCKLPSLTFR